MRGVLLDTNAALWTLSDSARLGPKARELLVSGVEVWFSAITLLEVTIKQMLGKIELPGDLAMACRAAGMRPLDFSIKHAEALSRFPELARHDPFDRMLLAQAEVDGLVLLTSDSALLGLGAGPVRDASA